MLEVRKKILRRPGTKEEVEYTIELIDDRTGRGEQYLRFSDTDALDLIKQLLERV